MIQVKKVAELNGHSGAVYTLEHAENEEFIYSGASDNIVAKWNLELLNAEKFAARFSSIIYSLCFIQQKNILLAGTSEGKIHVIDLAQKKEIKILQNHTQPVFDIKYSIETDLILSAGGDGTLAICSGEDLSPIKLLKLCNAKLRAIDSHKNEAAIACGDGMIRIIDLTILREVSEFPAHKESVYAVNFSPDGTYLLSGGKDAHLNKWLFQPKTLGFSLETSIPAHNFAIYSIVFSPDGKLFATASRDKTIKIWSVRTLSGNSEPFELLQRINKENYNGHINSVNKLLWSKYNNYLLSTGDDRKIMVWEINR